MPTADTTWQMQAGHFLLFQLKRCTAIGAMKSFEIDGLTKKEGVSVAVVVVHKATENNSMRISISSKTETTSNIEVNFHSKDDKKSNEYKSVVAVQQNKLASTQQVDSAKKFWHSAFDRLEQVPSSSSSSRLKIRIYTTKQLRKAWQLLLQENLVKRRSNSLAKR
jgi:hypothetical protein